MRTEYFYTRLDTAYSILVISNPFNISNMAICIPSTLPANATEGEKAVFAELQKLDNNCIVYYEPAFGNRYPDFVVIVPAVGVFVIEVKDWHEKTIDRVQKRHTVLRVENESTTKTDSPAWQLSRYGEYLENALKRNKYYKYISHGDRFVFDILRICIYRNINRHQFVEPKFISHNHDCHILFADDQSPSLLDLLRKRKLRFDLSDYQTAVIRSAIRPDSIIESDSQKLLMLDLEQEKLIASESSGHVLRYGPAGSGKTVILLARARLLVKHGKRCLILCYNKGLGAWLRSQINDPLVEVRTFNSWAYSHGFDFADRTPELLGENFHAYLECNKAALQRFDCILIDEVQEFKAEWIKCALSALQDQYKSELFMTGDGAQSPQRSMRIRSWRKIGVNVHGGERTRTLKKIYRNTTKIWKMSCELNAPENESSDNEAGVGHGTTDVIPPERVGPMPQIIHLQNRNLQQSYAVNLISNWLSGGFLYDSRREEVRPQDIAVIIPSYNAERLDPFISQIARLAPISIISSNTSQTISSKNLKIISIQSCKGLQFRHLVILHADEIRRLRFDSDDDARLWLQIAIRRAEFSLTVIHSGNCQLIDRLEHSLRPPAWNRPRPTPSHP